MLSERQLRLYYHLSLDYRDVFIDFEKQIRYQSFHHLGIFTCNEDLGNTENGAVSTTWDYMTSLVLTSSEATGS